jgi:hypothetical protein
MKHPMRTLLYDLLLAPLLQFWQRLLDLMIPPPRIALKERVPVPQLPLPGRVRDDLSGPGRPPREPGW